MVRNQRVRLPPHSFHHHSLVNNVYANDVYANQRRLRRQAANMPRAINPHQVILPPPEDEDVVETSLDEELVSEELELELLSA